MMNHPLEQTLARVRALNTYLKSELGTPKGEGWISPTDLAPGAVWLETMIGATQARLRTKAAAIIGSAILQSYQWPLISTAIACYVCDRRVPDLSVTKTLTHYNAAHHADALAFLGEQFICLPNDPAASHPDASVAPDPSALCIALRTGIAAHLGIVINQLCIRLGCKPFGLWLNVTDTLAGTLIWLAQLQQPAPTLSQLEAEIETLICLPGSPLNRHQVELIELHYQEQRRVFLNRATCCYWYKTDGGDYCSTCPHRTPEDRRERLLRYLAEEQARQQRVA